MAQLSPSVGTFHFPIAVVGDVLMSTDYGGEQVENVLALIAVTGTVGIVRMSAFVERSGDPHVALGYLVVTSIAIFVGYEPDERGYIQVCNS